PRAMGAKTQTTKKPGPRVQRAEEALARHALAYPQVEEEAPWGHRAFKVRGKTFLFLATDGGELSLSTKLPSSGTLALSLPCGDPPHYGLGKSGWVSGSFAADDDVPIEMLSAWIDESYRAIAPKKLAAALDTASAPAASSATAAAAKRTPA